MIKKAHDTLIKPLTLLINQTLSTCIFPSELRSQGLNHYLSVVNHRYFRIIDQSLYWHHYRKYMNMWFLNSC